MQDIRAELMRLGTFKRMRAPEPLASPVANRAKPKIRRRKGPATTPKTVRRLTLEKGTLVAVPNGRPAVVTAVTFGADGRPAYLVKLVYGLDQFGAHVFSSKLYRFGQAQLWAIFGVSGWDPTGTTQAL